MWRSKHKLMLMAGGIVVTRRLLQSKEGRHQEEREERANTSITRSCNSSLWRRETHRERKMAYVRELLTYCFLALLQCLGRDVGAVNGFCSNVVIWFLGRWRNCILVQISSGLFNVDGVWKSECWWAILVTIIEWNIVVKHSLWCFSFQQVLHWFLLSGLYIYAYVTCSHLFIYFFISFSELSGLPVDNETTTLFSSGCCTRLGSS